jgi:YhcH/YjgK/YiaL family protein
MIIDSLSNASAYGDISPRLAAAFEYLKRDNFATMKPGRYEIQGSDVFALVQTYDTRVRTPESRFEAHRQYIDVQFVASGKELLGYTNLAGLKVVKEYDEKDDYLLAQGEGNFLVAGPGTFMVFMPQDAHMPCMAVGDKPEPVLKVVVKVRV